MNKKEILRQYKENPPPMGIFQVKNLTNGKIFLGSGMDVKGKMNSCKFQLAHRSHMNKELQADFSLSGESNFSFEIIDTLEPNEDQSKIADELEALLQMWMEKLEPFDEKGYNKRKAKK